MLVNIKEIKTYMISPASGRYKERCEISLQRLKELGFKNVELFISIPANTGTESLSLTEYAIFKKELENNEPFIIVEDDLGVYKNIDTIEIPEDCDALYLGVSKWIYPHTINELGKPGYDIIVVNPTFAKEATETLTKINGMTATHAILFRNREFIRKIMETMDHFNGRPVHNDLMITVNHRFFNIYALKEPLFYQDINIGGQQEPTYLAFYEGRYRYISDIEEYRAGKPVPD